MNAERKERRGFASMSPEKQREIASKGGRAAHQKGTAHEWTSEEARQPAARAARSAAADAAGLSKPTDVGGCRALEIEQPSRRRGPDRRVAFGRREVVAGGVCVCGIA